MNLVSGSIVSYFGIDNLFLKIDTFNEAKVYNKCISIAGEVKLHGIARPNGLNTTDIIEVHGTKDASFYKYEQTRNQIHDFNANYGTDIKLITVDAVHGGKENVDETSFTTTFISPFGNGYDDEGVQSLNEKEQGDFYLMDWLLTPKSNL